MTGANKGVGFAVCKLLASKGIVVILTARDKTRGLEAIDKLKSECGPSDHVNFHQLDVSDPASVSSLVDFVKHKFGKLDILVNLENLSLFWDQQRRSVISEHMQS